MDGPSEAGGKIIVCTHNRIFYVAADEQKSYVWFNGDYLPVSDGAEEESIDIQIIHGGSPINK